MYEKHRRSQNASYIQTTKIKRTGTKVGLTVRQGNREGYMVRWVSGHPTDPSQPFKREPQTVRQRYFTVDPEVRRLLNRPDLWVPTSESTTRNFNR